MRVGILTFHFAYNYGAVLQAWGLQRAIESLGHDVCIINYVPEYMKGCVSPFRDWGLRSGRNFPKVFSHRVLGLRRRRLFSQFVKDHLKCSPAIRDKQSLRIFCQNLDAVVVGSDQVWNLSYQREFDDTYFLGFLDDKGPRKIGYGACFGREDQPSHLLPEAINLINRFDAIGMRNDFGRKILLESGSVKAESVVDPVFFLPPVTSSLDNNHIAVYAIAGEGAAICGEVAEQVAAGSQQQVIQVCSEKRISIPDGFRKVADASPSQWLDILGQASFICSESFHGAVIAIANKVPFVCASAGHRSSRITDLLDRYGFSERFLESAAEFRVDMKQRDLDYYPKLQSDIKASMDFLQKSL